LYPAHTAGTIKFQSGETTVLPSLNDDTCKYTIGEKLLSLKQLIMIPEVSDITLNSTVDYKGYMYPWYFQPEIPTATPPAVGYQVPFNAFSFAANISKCYAFARGGLDVHVYSTTPVLVSSSAAAVDFGAAPPTATPQLATVLNAPNSALPCVTQVDTCSAHFRYPAYQKFARLWADIFDANNWAVQSANVPPANAAFPASPLILPALPYINIYNGGPSNAALRITRNAADDSMLGMYQGPVPLYLPQLANTSATYDRTRTY